jgi:hemoglobin-like flavoprotein
MLTFSKLSDEEKQLLLSSLPIFSENLDLFVIKFYTFFLKTKAGELFHATELEKQYKMFHASLGIIITHIQHPEFLEHHIDSIIASHIQYGVKSEYIDYFIDSFMKAIKSIMGEKSVIYYDLWYQVIVDIMKYFENKLF